MLTHPLVEQKFPGAQCTCDSAGRVLVIGFAGTLAEISELKELLGDSGDYTVAIRQSHENLDHWRMSASIMQDRVYIDAARYVDIPRFFT